MGVDYLERRQKDLEDRLGKQIDYIQKEADKWDKIAQQAYNKHMSELRSFNNLGYDKKKVNFKEIVEKYVKGEDKKDLQRIFYKIETEVNKGKSITYGYKNTIDDIGNTKIKYNEVSNHRGSGSETYLVDLKNREGSLSEKLQDYQNRLEQNKHVLNELRTEAIQKLNRVGEKKSEKQSSNLLGNLIIVAMTTTFGASVLYALSNIKVSSLPTSAIIAGAATTQSIVMMVIASVILFLFFATHHKLEQ